MGRERNNRKGYDTNRDSGPFVALPCVVLDCPAYLSLSHPAKALLIEIARQYVRDNNGRLLASRAYLAKRGWTSADTIARALRELIAAKLIHQTVQGHFPKTASWYALTWRTLDRIPGYDAGSAESFERGSYAKQSLKNTFLRPSNGLGSLKIGPSDGLDKGAPRPTNGPIKALLTATSRPSDGHHLDKPSIEPESSKTKRQGKATAPALPDKCEAIEVPSLGDVRIRDAELSPDNFDPISGEFIQHPPNSRGTGKRNADRWLTDAKANYSALEKLEAQEVP